MLKSQAASLYVYRSTPHLSAQRRIEAPTYTVDGTPKYNAEAAKQRRTIRSPQSLDANRGPSQGS